LKWKGFLVFINRFIEYSFTYAMMKTAALLFFPFLSYCKNSHGHYFFTDDSKAFKLNYENHT